MNLEEIKTVLLQRYPFLFIDRVVSLNLEEKSIACYKNVSGNEPYFNGHFPGRPIMPGVLILEAMAQAAGILGISLSKHYNIWSSDFLYLFAGADKVKFKSTVVPGDRLDLRATLMMQKRYFYKFFCEAILDEKVICSAEVTCAKKEV